MWSIYQQKQMHFRIKKIKKEGWGEVEKWWGEWNKSAAESCFMEVIISIHTQAKCEPAL